MKVQKRIAMIFIVSLVLLLLTIVAYLYINKVGHENIQAEELKAKEYAVDIAIQNSGDYLMKFAVDYTLWDELVRFINKYDSAWAGDNINTLIKTTHIKYVWIFNQNRDIVHYLQDKSYPKIETPLSSYCIKKIMSGKKYSKHRFCHFYLRHDDIIIEVAGATVHGSDDIDRKTRPEGYFFIARIIDSVSIDDLEILTNSEVQLELDTGKVHEIGDFETFIEKRLRNQNGLPIAKLFFISEDKIGRSEDKFSKIYLAVNIVVILILMIFTFTMIKKNVSTPLGRIAKSLDTGDVKHIQLTKSRDDEFGQIAMLIEESFRYREQLENSSEQIQFKNDKLQELNATKDKFFSIIAHDLKNPFGVILQTTEFLANPDYDHSKEEFMDFSKDLNFTAKNLFNLLENLLTWARSQKGTIKFEPSTQKIHDLSETTKSVLNTQAYAKKITIINNVAEDIVCDCDRNMILTVFRNLTSNAIKFTNEEGEIRLSGKINDSGEAEFSVSDNGVGMSDENMKKLFRIDVNVSTIGTSQEKGTGLGLILCKEFVERHGGRIWVDSKIGEGSKFSFTLPLKQEIIEESK